MNIDVTQAAPRSSAFVTIGSDGTLSAERALTGTSNQITVTDNGAGSTVVLSTPQNIHTGASPTFAGLTVSGLTAGRVPFAATGGLFDDDAALTWDDTLKRLGVGTLFRTPDENIFTVSKNYTTQTYQNMTEQVRSAVKSIGSGDVRTGRLAFSAWCEDGSVVNKTITNAANNGSGLIRITATGHGFATSDVINIYGIVGTTEANSAWTITVIDANTFDLQGSTFTNAYVSGGTATNRSLMTCYRAIVMPALARDGVTPTNHGDDVCGYTLSNAGTAQATDGVWITDELAGSVAWRTLLSSDSRATYFLRFTGTADTTGIDLSASTQTGPAIALGNGHVFQIDGASGTLITSRTLTTQATGSVGAANFFTSITKNDTNTRMFPAVQIAPTINTGGSNTTTTARGLRVIPTFTAITGLSEYLGVHTIVQGTQPGVSVAFCSENIVASTAGAGFLMRKARGTAVGSEALAQSADVIGSITFNAYDAATTGQAYPTTFNAQLRVLVTENQDTTHHGAKMEFRTTPNASTTLATRMTISDTGNISPTAGTTGMTDGFFYIPAAAGVPSGTPTAVSGTVPMYYDTTNNKFYVYNGAWKSVTLA